jgi:hypothetical protein
MGMYHSEIQGFTCFLINKISNSRDNSSSWDIRNGPDANTRNKKRHYQQQDTSNSWDASYCRNTRNSTNKAVVLATANSLTDQKRDANNRMPKTAETPTTAGTRDACNNRHT